MVDSPDSEHVFREGDHVLLNDRKGRQYLTQLRSSGTFESHIGIMRHADLIGMPEGTWVSTARGHRMLAFRPTLADFTRMMPRIATVVYPKDLAMLLTYGDIFPGARVLEAGSGSGALTIALLRAVGEAGRLYSYDLREDMMARALANVDGVFPDHTNLTLKLGDVYEGFEERELDRVILDLPEPWRVVPHASESMVQGGIFLSFLPTVPQVQEVTQALRRQGTFALIDTLEVLVRHWSVAGRSVRPDHRMIGHTGFITTARKCSARPLTDEDDES